MKMTTPDAAGQVTATYEFQVTMTVRSPDETGPWSQVQSGALAGVAACQWITEHELEAAAVGLHAFTPAASSRAATPEGDGQAADVQAVSVAPNATAVPESYPA